MQWFALHLLINVAFMYYNSPNAVMVIFLQVSIPLQYLH